MNSVSRLRTIMLLWKGEVKQIIFKLYNINLFVFLSYSRIVRSISPIWRRNHFRRRAANLDLSPKQIFEKMNLRFWKIIWLWLLSCRNYTDHEAFIPNSNNFTREIYLLIPQILWILFLSNVDNNTFSLYAPYRNGLG